MLNSYIKKFSEISINDIAVVGGKNASLGQMFLQLSKKGIRVPDGFATTSFSFAGFLTFNSFHEPLHELMAKIDRQNFTNLQEIGSQARALILKGVIPGFLEDAITKAYQELFDDTPQEVAVRSSATAEDLPQFSFAGLHESYLNVKGVPELLNAVRNCFASLYTDRAIKYREDNGFAHEKVLLSVGVQKMVRADKACSGVAFTLEPESGFRDIVHISGTWGLGENLVQGTVTPDEFFVFKPALIWNKNPIVQRKLGGKTKMLVYGENRDEPLVNIITPAVKRDQLVLDDAEVIKLARWCTIIEEHYQKPMDIEWAKDGLDGEIYIIQARPETVHSHRNPMIATEYQLAEKGVVLAKGEAVGVAVTTGLARRLTSPGDASRLAPGEIVITDITSPDWDPILKKAGGIITNKGGRTSHASIVAREMGVPAIVGCGNATDQVKDGQEITLSCCEGKTGYVYKDKLPFKKIQVDLSKVRKPVFTKMMLITADPDSAYRLSFYPSDGVGLMRMEFIIAHMIRIHPMALVTFDTLKDDAVREEIEKITNRYAHKQDYFIERLSEGIATMAAAFYPREVILRTSDFKSNEYAALIGGNIFEPKEENPMLGLRGASRYYHDLYREGFRLECEAIKKVREEMGLTNVKVMIPFCRTVEEGHRVLSLMYKYGLRQGVNGLEVYVMAEIPSNVILADKFARVFDGFSIGSNDLTQLTLGLDRDSALVSHLFDEKDPAVKIMIASVIEKAKAAGVRIGLCGQAPSDSTEFTSFLVEQGVDSISFNPDALLKGIDNTRMAEQKIAGAKQVAMK